MRTIIILTAIAICFTKCTSQEVQKKTEENNHKLQIAMQKEKIVSALVSEYAISYSWDTLSFNYSVEYQPIMKTKYQLIEDFEVSDLYFQDSTEYLSIHTGFFPTFYFDFPVTRIQAEKFINMDNDLILVVSISSIKKIKFDVKGENIDNESITVNLEGSFDFTGKGILKDIISIPK